MTWQPYATPPACKTCGDVRRVETQNWSDAPCPSCGSMGPIEYKLFRSAHTAKTSRRPEIIERDLTDEEVNLLISWKKEAPETHMLTLLTWIEGRRYVAGGGPAADKEFVAKCDQALKEWKEKKGVKP